MTLPFSLENAVHLLFLTRASFSLKPASALQALGAQKSPPCSTLTARTPTAIWCDVDPRLPVHHMVSNLASRMLCFWSGEATWSLLFSKVDLMQHVTVHSLSCSSRKHAKCKILLFQNMLEQLIICVLYLTKKKMKPNKNPCNETEDIHQEVLCNSFQFIFK